MAVGLALGIVGGVVGLLFAGWHAATYFFVNRKCERPKFQIIKTIGEHRQWFKTVPKVQIRKYAPFLIAEVIMEQTDMRPALNRGFREIAGFIFGGNIANENKESEKVEMTAPVTLQIPQHKNEKIEMTAPVTSQFLGQQRYQVSFVMPSKYTKETLPKPVNPNVKIRQVEGHTMGAMKWYGGSPSQQQTMQKAEELRILLEQNGHNISGNLHLYQYHPPFSPPWMRENEVLFNIQK